MADSQFEKAVPRIAVSHQAGVLEDDGGMHGHRLERLIERLPPRLRGTVRWLRKPSSRWARIPAGLLLSFGGLLWILPFLGLWMLPLGLLLLAEDVPTLHRARARLLERIERRRPHWFAPAPRPVPVTALERDMP